MTIGYSPVPCHVSQKATPLDPESYCGGDGIRHRLNYSWWIALLRPRLSYRENLTTIKWKYSAFVLRFVTSLRKIIAWTSVANYRRLPGRQGRRSGSSTVQPRYANKGLGLRIKPHLNRPYLLTTSQLPWHIAIYAHDLPWATYSKAPPAYLLAWSVYHDPSRYAISHGGEITRHSLRSPEVVQV